MVSHEISIAPEIGKGAVSDIPAKQRLTPYDLERIEKWRDRLEEELGSNLDEAREWIFENCGSSQKLEALMHIHGQMYFPEWLELLGDIWSHCDNIGLYRDDLVEIIREWSDDPLNVIPKLITTEELTAFEALPEQITIYRGCGPRNKFGLSWSLSREIAVRFPFNIRYWTDSPTLLTATINKTRAAALKLERNEQEIIVIDLPESCWIEELISDAPPIK